ncbi:hypothetical protein HMPREF9140_00573 [Prevotella micans F0438]|uniref:Uncharacterized protein n=1 Tax=Prevotella micans F0438 TaxID=883158 RepID=H1Q0Y5_9BACT|nr:hypothetical protein HMPREF9140_00573 [Prevotella micans F0438]
MPDEYGILRLFGRKRQNKYPVYQSYGRFFNLFAVR